MAEAEPSHRIEGTAAKRRLKVTGGRIGALSWRDSQEQNQVRCTAIVMYRIKSIMFHVRSIKSCFFKQEKKKMMYALLRQYAHRFIFLVCRKKTQKYVNVSQVVKEVW